MLLDDDIRCWRDDLKRNSVSAQVGKCSRRFDRNEAVLFMPAYASIPHHRRPAQGDHLAYADSALGRPAGHLKV